MSKINFILATDGNGSDIERNNNVIIGAEDLVNIITATNYWWNDISLSKEQRQKIIKVCQYIGRASEDD